MEAEFCTVSQNHSSHVLIEFLSYVENKDVSGRFGQSPLQTDLLESVPDLGNQLIQVWEKEFTYHKEASQHLILLPFNSPVTAHSQRNHWLQFGFS